MSDPFATGKQQSIEPVHAGGEEAPPDKWPRRLVMFLRGMAGISLIKGLYHWAVVCGFVFKSEIAFADQQTPYQSATVFFAVIDLVAAVGLWLAAPWGAVVWLTSVISMIAVELLGGRARIRAARQLPVARAACRARAALVRQSQRSPL
jgi:hypothetical protein